MQATISMTIVASKASQPQYPSEDLAQLGLNMSVLLYTEYSLDRIAEQPPDIILVDLNDTLYGSELWQLPRRIKQAFNIPVMGLLPRKSVRYIDGNLGLDDFVICSCDADEIAARAKLVLWQRTDLHSGELIKSGDLLIDLSKCEVTISGRVIPLTFKEYELLKLMASNAGRVFSRETLLDKIWGYDYYGGDRTVDVHIRRLRSKIEDSSHTFIETVRNVGYRFREDT